MNITPVPGGITAPRGFRAAGVPAGIKASGAPDVALIVADKPAAAAALFTTNQVQAAPVTVSREHLAASGGRVSAVLVNSGCANACTGPDGLRVARESAAIVGERIGCPPDGVLVASTGVIGVALGLDKLRTGIARAHAALAADGRAAAVAIMTTDTGPKEHAVRVETTDGAFHVGGMAKGAGMIEPLLATMLAFITTDADVAPATLQRLLADVADRTFNAITVDGECSTNDTVIALASGASETGRAGSHHDEQALAAGIEAVCRELALMIVRGGEGATKLVAVRVQGAESPAAAKQVARTVANSPLVKTAVHGGDPNWGRLLAAAGRAGVPFDVGRARVRIGPVVLFRDGRPFDDEAPRAADYLQGTDLEVEIDLGGGTCEATVWTCDLSAEYVRINGEYRT